MIELTASDGHKLSAYRADPAGAPKGAVVVLQDGFGLTPHIKKMADDFAAKGYVALAPSLFDRVAPNVSLGYDQAGITEGARLIGQLELDDALADIEATVDLAKGAGKVAVVGYSWGADLAFAAANRVSGLACAIGYYGTGIQTIQREKRKIPTLIHFAEQEPSIPSEDITQFRWNRPDVSTHVYPAASGFNCTELATYNAEAAATALERTLFWISQFVEGQPPITLKNAGSYARAKTEKKKKKKESSSDDLGPPM